MLDDSVCPLPQPGLKCRAPLSGFLQGSAQRVQFAGSSNGRRELIDGAPLGFADDQAFFHSNSIRQKVLTTGNPFWEAALPFR
jgi:hypothetical protein